MTLTRDRRAELLAGCPLFTGLTPDDLTALADTATEVDFPADRIVARQGDIGTGMFIIVDGRVRVVRDGETIARLGPGEFFGELSVIDRRPRNAQVLTEAPTRCLALASWDFERTMLEHPSLALAIMRGLAARLREAGERARA